MTVAVALFSRDLRIRDSPTLAAARRDADEVVPLFVLDDAILGTAYATPNRLGFLLESLRDLDASLRERGGRLVVRRGDWVASVLEVAEQCDATAIHVARDVSGFAQRRIAELDEGAGERGIGVTVHDAVTVVPPGELESSSGGPFLVFTPYYKRWLGQSWRSLHAIPQAITVPRGIDVGEIPKLDALTDGERAPDVLPGGESEGIKRLRAWTSGRLETYKEHHDDVAGDRTSRTSPYLHFGCLSALEIATRLRDRPGGEAFVRQICWRDFYAQLLSARPEVAHEDVRNGKPRWSRSEKSAQVWRDGRTGFPLVDAGMRQLLREGWMHNRTRMVVASFLTKDLLIDWRVGAADFMAHLVDGDVAENQLNWQWVAGTGTDQNPHRVYNPTVQSRKFDPDGVYIRRYVEELADYDGDDIHDPSPEERDRFGYPAPLVEHREAIEHWRASRTR